MDGLARMMVATADLVEAEGRMLRQQLLRVFIGLGLGVGVLVLALVGVFFILLGLYRVLGTWIGYGWAASVFGLVALALAAGSLFGAKRVLR